MDTLIASVGSGGGGGGGGGGAAPVAAAAAGGAAAGGGGAHEEGAGAGPEEEEEDMGSTWRALPARMPGAEADGRASDSAWILSRRFAQVRLSQVPRAEIMLCMPELLLTELPTVLAAALSR